MKHQLNFSAIFYELPEIFSININKKITILDLLTKEMKKNNNYEYENVNAPYEDCSYSKEPNNNYLIINFYSKIINKIRNY